jgi:hypothetical protein
MIEGIIETPNLRRVLRTPTTGCTFTSTRFRRKQRGLDLQGGLEMLRNDAYTPRVSNKDQKRYMRQRNHSGERWISLQGNKIRHECPRVSYNDPALATITLSAEAAMCLDSFQCTPKHTTRAGAQRRRTTDDAALPSRSRRRI